MISNLTLELVEAMSLDPASPKGLRDFHKRQLEDLRRRAEIERRPARKSPFDKFLTKLENENSH